MLQQALMNRLKAINPRAYNALRGISDPDAYLREAVKSGRVTPAQLRQVQRQARLFGVEISDAQIAKYCAIDENSTKSRVNLNGLF